MTTINFVVRTSAGSVERGSMDSKSSSYRINVASGSDIFLNIGQPDLRRYDREANDLVITLADGRVIVLEGYFETGAERVNRLFLSDKNTVTELSFVQSDDNTLYAQYWPTENLGKLNSPEDQTFIEELGIVPFTGYGPSILGLPLFGGLAAASGGGGSTLTPPTINDPDAVIEVGGGDESRLMITGTANPGSEVEVTVGDKTVTSIAGDSRTWEVVFEGETFPKDGEYIDVVVVVTDPNGTVTKLVGPTFVIDTTPPAVIVEGGAVSTDDLFNAEDYSSGVSVSGTTEAGSTVTITVGEHTQTTTATDGTWSFSFDAAVLPAGEYVQAITITATDVFGNTRVITDGIEIDTIATVALTNALLTGDDRINAAEHGKGVTLTGTSQAGSAVMVMIAGVSQAATVAEDGSWTVTFGATTLPAGTYETSATITATDTAGNTATTTHGFSVDTETAITINTATVAEDSVVNASERADGVVLTGTAEAGAFVVVTIGSTTLAPVTAGPDGTWSVTVAPSLIPMGHATLAVSAVAMDSAGNVATASGNVAIDTQISISVNTASVAGDGTINAAERMDGTVLTGQTEPGATVVVTVGSGAEAYTFAPVTTNASGQWSVSIAPSMIPAGTTSLAVSAVAIDVAGNMAQTSGSIAIDTEIEVTAATDAVTSDGTINYTERATGVLLSGTSEPGAVVEVFVGANSVPLAPVTADANGNWTVQIPTGLVPSGQTGLTILAEATDAAGNTATTTGTILVDTLVDILNMAAVQTTDGPVSAAAPLNLAEAQAGVTLTGEVEAGSTVMVTLGGATFEAEVTETSWSLTVPSAVLAGRSGSLAFTVEATDRAMNVREIAGSIAIDTTPPEAPELINITFGVDGITSITTDTVPDAFEIGQVVPGLGGLVIEDLTVASSVQIPDVGTYHRFTSPVADGSLLVVSYSDDAGNTAGSLVVTDNLATNTVTITDQLAQALRAFQVETIDLHFAEDSHLTITETQILALSDTTDTVAVLGGADDNVTITGATHSGTTTVDGQGFNVFTLGDATILIDDQITNVNTSIV